MGEDLVFTIQSCLLNLYHMLPCRHRCIHSFIHPMCMYLLYLLCPRHCATCWRYGSERDNEAPVLVELNVLRVGGLWTDNNYVVSK